MNAFLDGARFEWAAAKRAPAALLILAGAAIFYSFIYPSPYAPQVYKNMPVYALDRDDSALSRRLLSHINASELLEIVEGSGDPRAAKNALQRGQVLGYIEIPKGLERDVTRGQSPAVGLFANAGYLMAYSQLADTASEVILEAGGEIGAAVEAEASGNLNAAAASQAPFGIDAVQLYDPAGGYASFVVPAVVMVIIQQTMLIGLGLLCEARRADAKGPPSEILPLACWILGRNLPWMAVYILQFLIIRWIIFPLYHLPAVGVAPQLIAFIALFTLTASLLGLLISELFQSSEDVIPFLLFTSLPVVFLSGFSWPLQVIPEPLRWFSYLIPSTAGVEGFVRLNQLGVEFSEVMMPVTNLILLCLLFGSFLVFVSRKNVALEK